MQGICSTGHPWLDGVPSCSCDALSHDVEGYVRFEVEPLPDLGARTVVGPHTPTTRAMTVVGGGSSIAVAVAPILSDDGWWQWDGAVWVPAATPPIVITPDLAPAPVAADPAPVVADAPPPGWQALPPAYAPPPAWAPVGPPQGTDGFAVASLVLSIVWLLGVGSALALVFAGVSRRQARREARPTSKVAVAGAVVGALGLLVAVGSLATHHLTVTTRTGSGVRHATAATCTGFVPEPDGTAA